MGREPCTPVALRGARVPQEACKPFREFVKVTKKTPSLLRRRVLEGFDGDIVDEAAPWPLKGGNGFLDLFLVQRLRLRKLFGVASCGITL